MGIRLVLLITVLVCLGPSLQQRARAQSVTKDTVAGVRNFARLESTVACAGAINPAEAVPEIKKMGFASVINLREATEADAKVEEEEAAVKAAGLRYYYVPFNGRTPDPKAADRFIDAITSPGAEPAFIHCGGGNRAATMWLIKRLVVDKWDEDRAVKEAAALGQTSEELRRWALDYAQSHKR
ncbi:MAG TPA: sulfur transferase domain-containing protein [Vicinamibacterales bacterium]|nr:sulfur transferase domain-containing protein [Vicinamibacterales bacterium]